MLLERDEDLAAAYDVLHQVTGACTGRLLVLEGPPGIGKTRFLGELGRRTRADGHRLLTATGEDLERDVPFGVARQLLRAASSAMPGDVSAPAAAALGLGPSPTAGRVDAGRAEADALDALHHLCVMIAQAGPLVLAVDDVHWADSASVRFLLYLARRLADVPILLVVAVRASGPASRALELQLLLGRADRVLALSSLTRETSARLIATWFGEEPTADFATACAEATGGNPLLLTELLTEALAEQIRPRDEDAPRLRNLGSTNVARGALLRVTRLGPAAVDIAGSAALLGSQASLPLVAAVAGVAPDRAELIVDGLVDAHLLRPGRPLRFVHPLVHSAIYRHTPMGLRSQRHREAARLLAFAGAGADEVAQHLLHTTPARDGWVRDHLALTGLRALDAGAPTTAVRLLRRALDEDPLTVDPELLLRLGQAEGLIRDRAALGHLEQAFRTSVEPTQLARAALPLARGLAYRTRYAEAMDVLDRTIARTSPDDRETLLRLHAERLWLLESGDLTESGFTGAAEQLGDGLTGDSHGERLVLGHLGTARLFTGAPHGEVRRLARLSLGDGKLLAEEGPESPSWLYSAALLWVVGDYADAELEMLRGEHRARDRGAVTSIAQIRATRAWVHVELGDLRRAHELASEVGASAGGPRSLGSRYVRACLVTIATETGEYAAAAEMLAGLPEPTGPLDRFDALLLHARAELRLAQGDPGGVDDLLEVGRWCDEHAIHNPGEWAWRTDVAPALAARGEQDRARQLVAEDLARARQFGVSRALGRALHAAAVVGPPGDERLELLREAVSVLSASPARLATAKAQLGFGVALRAEGLVGEAQAAFREALAGADACGAAPLRDDARRLLLSVGSRPRRTALSGPAALTPMECEVSQHAADGWTNRQIGARLYISVKAVEKHLHNVFLKLDIRSRSELAAALSAPASDEAAKT